MTTIIELAHRLDLNVPRSLTAVPFEHHLTSQHAPFAGGIDPSDSDQVTSATDAISIGCHTGTHLDSLSHISRGGRLHDGTRIDDEDCQSEVGGVRAKAAGRELHPVYTRGVLLDFAGFHGKATVDGDVMLTPQDLKDCAAWARVEIRPGDAVLIRTGWDTLASDRDRFTAMPCPGPELEAARYLSSCGVSVVGSDTMPFEAAPGVTPLAVHGELIADHGIQIMEMLDLRELAKRQAYEFTLVVAPLRIVGGTGSPVNPLAILNPDT